MDNGHAPQIRVIGASMAGAMAGYHLARTSKKLGIPADITIHEARSDFHKTCSGIVTSEFEQVLKRYDINIPRGLILSKVTHANIYAPDGRHLSLEFKRPDLVFDRERLNEHFIEEARKAGCEVSMKSKFIGFSHERNNILINDMSGRESRKRDVKSDILVGADGALSIVGTSAGLITQGRPRRFFLAIKTLIRQRHDNAIEFYPHYRDFAWRNPVGDDMIEIGVATELDNGGGDMTARQVFGKFSRMFPGKHIQKEAALIPIYDPGVKFFKKHNGIPTYLIGDAATHAKATTGGSIVQIHKAAPLLADAALKGNGASHESAVRKAIGHDLWLHLKMHNALRKFNDNDWNLLVSKFDDDRMREILATHSRDRPLPLITDLLMRKPSLLRFVTKLI